MRFVFRKERYAIRSSACFILKKLTFLAEKGYKNSVFPQEECSQISRFWPR